MFCPNCGTQQQAQPQQPQPQQPEPQQFQQQPQPQQFQQQPQQFQQQQQGFQQQQQGFQQQQQFGGQPGYVPYQSPQPQPMFYNNGNERILAFFKDTLFLVVTILFSVSVLCSLFRLSLPVIEILYTIFFWIIFVAAKKNAVATNQIKWLSGTTFAKIILNYVAAGLVLVLGFIAMAGVSALGGAARGYGSYGAAAASAAGSVGIIVLVVCIVIAAVIVVITIFGIRPVQKFTQSAYKSLEAGSLMVIKPGTAKVWLMIFGIVKGLSAIGSLASGAVMTGALSSVMSQVSSKIPVPLSALGISTGLNIFGFLSEACLATAYIMLSITFGKYFGDVVSYDQQPMQ